MVAKLHQFKVTAVKLQLEGVSYRLGAPQVPGNTLINNIADTFYVLYKRVVHKQNVYDITQMIYENKDHPYYDPILSGFDLDAVLAYDANQSTSVAVELDADISISNNQLQVSIGGISDVQIFDLMGRNVLNKEASGDDRIDLNQLNRGVYLVVIRSGKKLVTKKIMVN